MIGGADGLDAEFKAKADGLIRISSLTFAARDGALLAEQLYRAPVDYPKPPLSSGLKPYPRCSIFHWQTQLLRLLLGGISMEVRYASTRIPLIALTSLFALIPTTPPSRKPANDAIDTNKARIVEQHDLSMRGMIRLVHETPEQFENLE